MTQLSYQFMGVHYGDYLCSILIREVVKKPKLWSNGSVTQLRCRNLSAGQALIVFSISGFDGRGTRWKKTIKCSVPVWLKAVQGTPAHEACSCQMNQKSRTVWRRGGSTMLWWCVSSAERGTLVRHDGEDGAKYRTILWENLSDAAKENSFHFPVAPQSPTAFCCYKMLQSLSGMTVLQGSVCWSDINTGSWRCQDWSLGQDEWFLLDVCPLPCLNLPDTFTLRQ